MNDRGLSDMAQILESGNISNSPTVYPKYLKRWHSFRDILRQAENNVTLDDALRQVEMIYTLIQDEEH